MKKYISRLTLKLTAFGSPSRASSSRAGPPPFRISRPNHLADLSYASPIASSTVVPSWTYCPRLWARTRRLCPPEQINLLDTLKPYDNSRNKDISSHHTVFMPNLHKFSRYLCWGSSALSYMPFVNRQQLIKIICHIYFISII